MLVVICLETSTVDCTVETLVDFYWKIFVIIIENIYWETPWKDKTDWERLHKKCFAMV